MKRGKKAMQCLNLYKLFISLIVIIIACCSLFLPSFMLNRKLEKDLNKTMQAPKEYYNTSTSAISKELSSQMSSYEKMELITGIWPREIQEVSISDTDFNVWDYIDEAKSDINNLYLKELYTSQITTDYNNWYTFDARLYLCTDTTFNTYSTYYWILTFTKYDRSQVHHVLLTNDGVLLCAYNCPYEEEVDILELYIESINDPAYSTDVISENSVTTDDTCLYFNIIKPEDE